MSAYWNALSASVRTNDLSKQRRLDSGRQGIIGAMVWIKTAGLGDLRCPQQCSQLHDSSAATAHECSRGKSSSLKDATFHR